MANRNQDDPLSSLFRASASPPDPSDVPDPAPRATDTPDPGQVRPTQPVSRPPAPAGPDPATLAKILARAAAAKAGAPAKPVGAAPAAPAKPAAAKPAAPAPKPAAAPAPKAEPASRLAGLAAPMPGRKMSAAEALEAARLAEAAAKAAPPPAPKAAAPAAPSPAPQAVTPTLVPPSHPGTAPAPVAAPPAPAVVSGAAVSDAVQDIVAFALPNAAIYVPAAVVADDRATLRPLWKAHRARLVAARDIERAAVAAAVVEALTARPAGTLAAAQLHLDGGDFLGWFDLQAKALIGVLPDPNAWGVKFE